MQYSKSPFINATAVAIFLSKLGFLFIKMREMKKLFVASDLKYSNSIVACQGRMPVEKSRQYQKAVKCIIYSVTPLKEME